MSILKEHAEDSLAMSDAYAGILLKLIDEDKRIVDVEADLGRALEGPDALAKMINDYPDQFLDCGIQESNMVSVAAGLSLAGRVPIAHSFAAFISRRVFDQVVISGSYNKANVKLIGSNPGICPALDGGTHFALEDVACFRAVPGMVIAEPADNVALKAVMKLLIDHEGMTYMRLFRKNPVMIYDEDTVFELGKAQLVKDGSDVTIIAQGIMLAEALKAADLLEKEGISARVLDMFTVKPIDEEAIIKAAKETGAIVTCENHSVINGLGTAVADVLAASTFAPLEKIGVLDRFGEVGDLNYLKKELHLTADDICGAAKKAISRK